MERVLIRALSEHFAFIILLMSKLKSLFAAAHIDQLPQYEACQGLSCVRDNSQDNPEPLCYKLDEATTHRDQTAHKLFKLL